MTASVTRLQLQASCALDLAERHERYARSVQPMIDMARAEGFPTPDSIIADQAAAIACAASERQRAALLKHEADELMAAERCADRDRRYASMSTDELFAELEDLT